MSERFIKYIPSEKADWLQENYPNAFLLLCQIAKRARRYNGHIDGLEIGMASIGDYKTAGIETEKKYRLAKAVLVQYKLIEIIETRKNCKKRATKKATNGTLVKLLNSEIWDINSEIEGEREGEQRATKGRPKGDEQERRKKEERMNKENTNISSEGKKLPSKATIVFSFENRKFENILPIDLAGWQSAYPGVEIASELLKMEQWILGNSTRSPKTQYRAFITRWLTKAQNDLAFKASKTVNNTKSRKEQVQERFQHGKIYSGAECFISDEAIAFQRGMTHYQVKFKDFAFEEQLTNIITKLGISS